MTPKHEAIANLTALQTPEPKRRRTAQEQALAPLLKERERIFNRYAAAKDKAHELCAELLRIDKMIGAIRETDDEQAPPESE